jgi:hypothetical protein
MIVAANLLTKMKITPMPVVNSETVRLNLMKLGIVFFTTQIVQ